MLKYYVILTTHSSHHYSMWDFTHTCNPIIFLLCVSFCLFVGFKTSSWVMNKSYLLPPRLMSFFFFFFFASSMGLYVSTLHVFYPSWEPHTLSLSSTIGNNTPLLGLFQDHLCGLHGLACCNI